jgi:hypothetical protein
LAHAGHRGNWWALVTNNEKVSGTPVVQGAADPAPGYYVSRIESVFGERIAAIRALVNFPESPTGVSDCCQLLSSQLIGNCATARVRT